MNIPKIFVKIALHEKKVFNNKAVPLEKKVSPPSMKNPAATPTCENVHAS